METLVCLVLLIGLTVPGLAGAAVGALESSNLKQPLSLDTAVAIALDKNPSIRAALEGIMAAKEASSEARAPFYPDLGFAAGYNRWERHAFLPSGLVRPDIPKIIGPTNDWHTGLQTSYILFDSGQRRAELQAALARVGAAEEDAAMNRQDIILLVHQAYFGLMAAKEAEAVARKKLARAEEHSRLAIARKEAGAVPRADVVRAQVEIADARLALEREASVVRIARGSLNTAMGLPAETSTEINDKYPDVAPPAALQIQESLELAIHERPEIKAARKRIEAATRSVTVARSAFGPKVRAEGSFGWRDSELIPHDKDWMAGFSVELPLFTGFSSKHRLGRTKAELSRGRPNSRLSSSRSGRRCGRLIRGFRSPSNESVARNRWCKMRRRAFAWRRSDMVPVPERLPICSIPRLPLPELRQFGWKQRGITRRQDPFSSERWDNSAVRNMHSRKDQNAVSLIG